MKTNKPMGFWMCTALIIGNVIGMGIFMLPASLAPYGFNAFIGWAITLFGCLLIAQIFAYFARAFPHADGPYAYTRTAFGHVVAFAILWCYWVSVCITNSTLAIGIVGYLSSVFPILAENLMLAPACAIGLIWFFVGVNLRGVHTSGRVQMTTTLLKILPMVAVLILGGYLLVTDARVFVAQLPTTAISLEASAAAGTIALFAMLGVESATIPAGKVEDSERTIPRATMAGTMITAVIYIGVSAIPLLLIPQTELANSNAPIVDLFQRYMNADSGAWIALFVIVSGLGALNGWTMIAGEMTVSMSNHGIFPRFLKVHNSRGAPTSALVVTGFIASLMIGMNYSHSLAQGFTLLSLMVTVANMPLYLIAALGLFKLWKQGRLNGVGSRSLILPSGAVLASLYCVWVFYGVGAESLIWVTVLGLLSLPIYVLRQRWLRQSSQQAATEKD
ncbi:APC family permease [Undibacterium fentianense]|uniref:Arginine/agmatine antiporter n=1 Tax=Undibacterium fentianense TaxID=2828728 RepID=A0A941IC06_9BURK|nr:amino acid permease [Undibacterium fentianense]MBR7799669.1 amino acid permease [Undibacterium fentianense]